jgi:hypothetical protein
MHLLRAQGKHSKLLQKNNKTGCSVRTTRHISLGSIKNSLNPAQKTLCTYWTECWKELQEFTCISLYSFRYYSTHINKATCILNMTHGSIMLYAFVTSHLLQECKVEKITKSTVMIKSGLYTYHSRQRRLYSQFPILLCRYMKSTSSNGNALYKPFWRVIKPESS